jgi:hypothetical protein
MARFFLLRGLRVIERFPILIDDSEGALVSAFFRRLGEFATKLSCLGAERPDEKLP